MAHILKYGQKIKASYEVEKFLGEGAFAEVYRVRHRFLGRQAMKVFKRTGLTAAETEEMLGEAILLSQIGHPNIVRVFNADIVDIDMGTCGFFTMEYIAGGTLDRFWRSFEDQFVPTEQSVNIIRQVCEGLSVAHRESPPIIHRDVKPQNILVGYDRSGVRVRLADFGLAKKVNPMTLLASAHGTLAFKAPEFLDGNDSPSTDVWAVGSTLYLLLTDQLPYPELDEEEFISGRRWSRPIAPPSRLNIDVDPLLESIVLKSLALKPGERYCDSLDLLRDLAKWTKPEQAKGKCLQATSSVQKSALGVRTPIDRAYADKTVRKALKLAEEPNRLMDAADLLEEAINAAPELRDRYEYRVSLWRRGLSM
jgi:eukaryotic-like serine/threonine-protein kinase